MKDIIQKRRRHRKYCCGCGRKLEYNEVKTTWDGIHWLCKECGDKKECLRLIKPKN